MTPGGETGANWAAVPPWPKCSDSYRRTGAQASQVAEPLPTENGDFLNDVISLKTKRLTQNINP